MSGMRDSRNCGSNLCSVINGRIIGVEKLNKKVVLEAVCVSGHQ